LLRKGEAIAMGAKEGKSEEDISNPFLWVFLAF
jgi:hypothetical protein